MRNKIILIGGPTASGKSGLALNIAQAIDGVIVNADSMQVYHDLAVITARPSPEDEMLAPHYLYGILPGNKACSAAFWAHLAHETIKKAWNEGRTPIVAGGTGLYFRALMEGLAPVPEIAEDTRRAVRDLMRDKGPAFIHEQLRRADPLMAARLNPGDSQRLARALEVIEATGRSLLDWQTAQPEGGLAEIIPPEDIARLVILPDRDILYARCDARLRLMITEMGGLDEVKRLISLNYPAEMPVMKALGVPQLAAFLAGEIDLEAAIHLALIATRQYAKRQLTWFRNQCGDWKILNAQYSESYYDEIFSFINNFLLTKQD